MRKICIIGQGNMGSYLAAGLADDERFEIERISSRSKTGGLDISEIDLETGLVFLAVPDDAVIEVARQLNFLTKAMIVHCSGTLGLDFLETQQDVACFWPIYSIKKEQLPTHRNVPIVLCAKQNTNFELLRKIASNFTDLVYELSPEKKLAAHLMAVLTNNFMTHLAAATAAFAQTNNIPFDLVQPIITQTFENISAGKAVERQTGPAIRRDQSTIEKHIALLQNTPKLQQLYKSFVASIQAINPQK